MTPFEAAMSGEVTLASLIILTSHHALQAIRDFVLRRRYFAGGISTVSMT